MFSHIYSSLDKEVRKIIDQVIPLSNHELLEILEKSKTLGISLEEIARLLEIGQNDAKLEQLELLRTFIYSEFRKEENKLRHIAPIYLSSYCIDSCSYCNFSAKNKDAKRTRLLLTETTEELQSILEEGSRVIEFTLATDSFFTSEKLAEYIAEVKKMLSKDKGSGVLLCADHFLMHDYYRLKEAGLWGIVQWDETLDKERYAEIHESCIRKSQFEKRIDTHDKAIQAGLEIAIGCLFGLNDYRYDTLMQIAKSRYLWQEYGIKPFVFGTPRIKAIAGRILHLKDEISDMQYELALMVYKIAEPQIARWLQTRETPELNMRNMVDMDVYTYRCGEVKPGGYKVNKDKVDSCRGSQFGVNEMTKEQSEQELRKRRFNVDYAWIN